MVPSRCCSRTFAAGSGSLALLLLALAACDPAGPPSGQSSGNGGAGGAAGAGGDAAAGGSGGGSTGGSGGGAIEPGLVDAVPAELPPCGPATLPALGLLLEGEPYGTLPDEEDFGEVVTTRAVEPAEVPGNADGANRLLEIAGSWGTLRIFYGIDDERLAPNVAPGDLVRYQARGVGIGSSDRSFTLWTSFRGLLWAAARDLRSRSSPAHGVLVVEPGPPVCRREDSCPRIRHAIRASYFGGPAIVIPPESTGWLRSLGRRALLHGYSWERSETGERCDEGSGFVQGFVVSVQPGGEEEACAPGAGVCGSAGVCDGEGDLCSQDASTRCLPRPGTCGDALVPACGCDGRVWTNPCLAAAAGVELDSASGCPSPAGTFPCGAYYCRNEGEICVVRRPRDPALPDERTCEPRPRTCPPEDRGCRCGVRHECGGWCTEDAGGQATLSCPRPGEQVQGIDPLCDSWAPAPATAPDERGLVRLTAGGRWPFWFGLSDEFLAYGDLATDQLYLLELATGLERPLGALPAGFAHGIDLDDSWLVATLTSCESSCTDVLHAVELDSCQLRHFPVPRLDDRGVEPDLDGGRVVYTPPSRSEPTRTTLLDLATGQQQLVPEPGLYAPKLGGDWLIASRWDGTTGTSELVGLRLSTGEVTAIAEHPYLEYFTNGRELLARTDPRIAGEHRALWRIDLESLEARVLAAHARYPTLLHLAGDTVAFLEWGDGSAGELVVLELETGLERLRWPLAGADVYELGYVRVNASEVVLQFSRAGDSALWAIPLGPPACRPLSCPQRLANCGAVPDGCGNTLDCGACAEPELCGGAGVPGVCGDPSLPWRPMPDSATSHCVDEAGAIDCLAASPPLDGQDGAIVVRPPSYVVGPNAALDAVTGLVWARSGLDQMTWQDAADSCAALGLAGLQDWRLPTELELVTLLDHGKNTTGREQSIDVELFARPASYRGTTWSATPGPGWDPLFTGFRVVAFEGPEVVPGLRADRQAGVRCVHEARGPAPAIRFAPAAETVADSWTGLTWQRHVGDEAPGWRGALTACDALLLGGLDDWRLPTAKELQTIVDPTTAAPPAIDLALFPGTPASRFWTATPGVSGEPEAPGVRIAFVDFELGGGAVTALPDEAGLRHRCVRGGR